MMAEEAVITLDKSRPFSECRGERAPDDPHYRVHFWQGQSLNKRMVLLPFDSGGDLVPDDGRTAPYPGIVDGKPVMHQPLYTVDMRALVELKKQRHKSLDAEPDGSVVTTGDVDASLADDDVNLIAWLRGQARYDWPLLQAATKKRYSRMFMSKREMVTDLVLDEKLVPEEQVCPDLAKLLPERKTA